MFLNKKSFFFSMFLAFINLSLYARVQQVYDVNNKTFLSLENFYSLLSEKQYVVMGEFHNDPIIQSAEGEIIEKVAQEKKVPGTFSLMWEFLDFTEQKSIALNFEAFKNDSLSAEDLISNTAGKNNLDYVFMMEAIKKVNGDLIALNLPRSLKQEVIKNGLSAIDQNLVPKSHYLGGANYYSRFSEAMGGHLPSSKLDAYFLAQSLTDSVMANYVIEESRDLNFIVAGSFHTDFFDGTVEKMKKLGARDVALLKLVNEKNITPEERSLYILGDSIYGNFSDYVIFCGE